MQSVRSQNQKVLDLENVIRTETVFSRFPFHNLSKKETLEILVASELDQETQSKQQAGKEGDNPRAKRLARRLSQYEIYWKVTANLEYGEPRQLAYDVDTLVINKVLDQVERPLPKWINIGTMRGICRELGLKRTGTTDLRNAILQNSSAYVTLKIGYTDKHGKGRKVEDHNTRYGVRFTGQAHEEGTAEAVYLSFNEPFRSILNNTRPRPMDYAYLRSLKPAARRFYELTSYAFYAAFKNHQPTAKVRYSEYCKYAPQKRLTDRHRAQTQMGKLHRTHMQSGYLAKVKYEPTTDTEGRRDWIIRYTPGPAAREEFDVFNGPKIKAAEAIKKPRLVPEAPKTPKRPAQVKIEPDSAPQEPLSQPLARYLELFPRARRTRTAEQLAKELVENHCEGNEQTAVYVVEHFARATEETGWREKVQTFEALFSQERRYISEALKKAREGTRQVEENRSREAEQRRLSEREKQLDQEAEYYWNNLADDDRKKLTEEAEASIRSNDGWMKIYERMEADKREREIKNLATVHARNRVRKSLREQTNPNPELEPDTPR